MESKIALTRYFRVLATLLSLTLLASHCAFASAAETGAEEPAPVPPPVFNNDPSNYTNSGSIKITWSSQSTDAAPSGSEFELQRATDSLFSDAKTYYRGPDQATYISGLMDGSYYYRVREIYGGSQYSGWSSTFEVIVEHHSLNLAFTLFGIGAVVFILTLIVVMRGSRRTVDKDNSRTIIGDAREA